MYKMKKCGIATSTHAGTEQYFTVAITRHANSSHWYTFLSLLVVLKEERAEKSKWNPEEGKDNEYNCKKIQTI